MSEFTTLVVKGLNRHPRKVLIDGTEYEVVCSSEGHIPAQTSELEQFVDCARGGDLDDMNAKEVRSSAQLVKDLSSSMRNKGYDG